MHERPVRARRVLLAEDHPVGQRAVTAMLENLGFRVDVVGDGVQALRAAAVTTYHAILMDCQLPLIDGYDATVAIRQLPGPSRHTPIIAVTASDDQEELTHCLSAGMDAYLTKPLDLRTLAAVLTRWGGNEPGTNIDPDAPEPHTFTPSTLADTRTDVPVLNAAIVERLGRVGRVAGEDLMGQLTLLFLDDAATQVARMRRAFASGDAAAIARSAHTLRGSSANLGATRLAEMCAALVAMGTAGDLTDGPALLDAVEVELEQVRVALGSLEPAS